MGFRFSGSSLIYDLRLPGKSKNSEILRFFGKTRDSKIYEIFDMDDPTKNLGDFWSRGPCFRNDFPYDFSLFGYLRGCLRANVDPERRIKIF